MTICIALVHRRGWLISLLPRAVRKLAGDICLTTSPLHALFPPEIAAWLTSRGDRKIEVEELHSSYMIPSIIGDPRDYDSPPEAMHNQLRRRRGFHQTQQSPESSGNSKGLRVKDRNQQRFDFDVTSRPGHADLIREGDILEIPGIWELDPHARCIIVLAMGDLAVCLAIRDVNGTSQPGTPKALLDTRRESQVQTSLSGKVVYLLDDLYVLDYNSLVKNCRLAGELDQLSRADLQGSTEQRRIELWRACAISEALTSANANWIPRPRYISGDWRPTSKSGIRFMVAVIGAESGIWL